MRLRTFLIWMTFVAVLTDYLLHPFYPHFFQLRFRVAQPEQVGYYFSGLCGMVMISFPFWAWMAKKYHELRLLVFTQLCAGILAICCFQTNSYLLFWILSMVMVFFKGSYLLVYPYTLKVVPGNEHQHTIGILSVIVHLGSILGAVLGGSVLEFMHPMYIFFIMAAGDFIQMGMSIYLLKSKRFNLLYTVDAPGKSFGGSLRNKYFLLKIGVVTLLLYWSDYLIRPFFTRYWESISAYDSKLLTGCIYAIPGFVAIGALWYNARRESNGKLMTDIVFALSTGILGLLLQGIPNEISVLAGRLIYGWAIFQATVKFDVLLFQNSTPENYAMDYSKVHFIQSLGVLIASSLAGMLVTTVEYQLPFPVALIGFVLTLILLLFLFPARKKQLVKQPEV